MNQKDLAKRLPDTLMDVRPAGKAIRVLNELQALLRDAERT